MVVTAPRGRGKSALAGMHIARLATTATVTAPGVLQRMCLPTMPGRLILSLRMRYGRIAQGEPLSDWLIVDEAAAIPGPLLATLVSAFRYVLLTTTVQVTKGPGRASY
jgi:tRNA(Met) cytidine acetyltransferase